MSNQIFVPAYNAVGTEYTAVISEIGTSHLYRASTKGGSIPGPDDLTSPVATITLDVAFTTFQGWPVDRRIGSPVYNGGQHLTDLIP